MNQHKIPTQPIIKQIMFRSSGVLILFACFLAFFFYPHDRFFEVVEGRLYRSAQPSAKDLTKIIKSKDIQTVINLRGEKTGEKWFTREQRVCKQNNVTLLNFDMEDPGLPKRRVLQGIIRAIQQAEKPMLIHCRRGVNQTGFVSALALSLETDPLFPVVESQLSWRFGLIPVYRSIGTPIFSVYRSWLDKNSKKHTRKTLLDWLENEYNDKLTPFRYYIDGINQDIFKDGSIIITDSSDSLTIHGWAFCLSTRRPPKHFQVFVDQQPLPPVKFLRDRPDVASYFGLGPPFEQTFIVGWKLTIARDRFAGGTHNISLQIGTADGDITAIPTTLTFRII